MTELGSLPNIGRVVAEELARAGIADAESLVGAGSVQAAARLRAAGFDVCRSKLGGLEGAVRGIRWTLIPAEERRELWKRLESLTSDR
jgi:DNA transformation protein and related proteins